jgi:hypothetical protein
LLVLVLLVLVLVVLVLLVLAPEDPHVPQMLPK